MPIDTKVTARNWYRYAWVRDQGHLDYCKKHDLCERFFSGDQWDPADKAALRAVRRPALTINKIISTISNVMGEQIYNRAETSYTPRKKGKQETANILAKVFKSVADKNQLDWKRSEMFADGIIGSRGFLDMRMSFDESLKGDIVIENINPKNVLIDPDADQYDPDSWNEVIITRWMTADDIEVMYSADDAKLLRGKGESAFPYGYDSIDSYRERFGKAAYSAALYGLEGFDEVNRNIRVIERQFRKLDKQLQFVYPKTGESRPVPEAWEEARIKYVAKEFGLQIIKKLVRRIRWLVTADNVVLHDEWSPYKHFTIIPYFPYFRRGRTIGLVENLLDPQELLNKVSSQELHVVNTTANSGWKVRTGALTNMSIEELEARGAETGLVVEVNGDPDKDVVRITPNTVPQGLDRIGFKSEGHIDSISGVNNSMKGFDREDVASKAIEQKKKSGQTNLVKPLDSLARTDYILGRNALDLIQEFYSDERVETIIKDSVTGETEEFVINEVNAIGEVVNDLTIGEYATVITSVPHRETLEDSEFEQLVSLRRDLGVPIKDEHIVAASRLRNKQEVIRDLKGDRDSAEAQRQAQLAARAQEAAVSKEEGEAKAKHADASLRQAKAVQIAHETANPDQSATPGLDVEVAGREQNREDMAEARDQARKDAESSAKIDAIYEKSNLERDKATVQAQLDAQAQAEAAAQQRVQRKTGTPKEPA